MTAQVIPRRQKPRIQLQRLTESFLGFRGMLQAVAGDAEKIVAGGRARVYLEALLGIGFCLCELAAANGIEGTLEVVGRLLAASR
jgi:hypothetical protein